MLLRSSRQPGGKVQSAQEAEAEPKIEFEDGSTATFRLDDPGSSGAVRDKNNSVEYLGRGYWINRGANNGDAPASFLQDLPHGRLRIGASPSGNWVFSRASPITSLARVASKDASLQEGRRAMELRPIAEDADEGPTIATYVAEVYALANQLDLALNNSTPWSRCLVVYSIMET